MKGRKRAVGASMLDSVTRKGVNVTVRFLSLDIGARPNYAVEFKASSLGVIMDNIIFKTVAMNGRNLKYWSDDQGLSWYWVGKRTAPVNAKPFGTNMQTIKQQFIIAAAKAFFASAWADACEEAEQDSMLSGKEIFDIMPAEIDPAAIHAAKTLYMGMARTTQRSIEDMMLCIEESGNGDRENSIESFGHYSAMQAMGHGVGLRDAFGKDVSEAIRVPYIEFCNYSLDKDYF